MAAARRPAPSLIVRVPHLSWSSLDRKSVPGLAPSELEKLEI